MFQKWFQGMVVKGYGKAKETGYPTANIVPQSDELFRPGVYGGFAGIENKIYQAAIVIGVEAGKVELFLFDFDSNLYDQKVAFWIQEKVGDIVYFDTEEALQTKIEEDIQSVQKFLKTIKKPNY